MIAQSEYKWGTIGGTFFVTWFNSSTVDTLQAVWAGINKFNETDPEVLSPDPHRHNVSGEEHPADLDTNQLPDHAHLWSNEPYPVGFFVRF
uniref:Uncharacterized protein n=1 Tax=Magallana gigas TaxID=29159 RepID=A0A8W8MHN8_MAGGI